MRQGRRQSIRRRRLQLFCTGGRLAEVESKCGNDNCCSGIMFMPAAL
jgi:hypothetical protein